MAENTTNTVMFHSTRSNSKTYTSKQAIRSGIAEDGGLFVTDCLGETRYNISNLVGKSYKQIAKDVLQILLPDFTSSELDECVENAYGDQWEDCEITPLKQLGTNNDFVLELFHGPTCAFKDVALQILPQLIRCSRNASDSSQNVMILTATSGDTGNCLLYTSPSPRD